MILEWIAKISVNDPVTGNVLDILGTTTNWQRADGKMPFRSDHEFLFRDLVAMGLKNLPKSAVWFVPRSALGIGQPRESADSIFMLYQFFGIGEVIWPFPPGRKDGSK